MVEERTDDEILVDYLLYAPLGAAIVAIEQAPRAVERLRNRVGVARVIGRFAVQEAWRRMAAPSTSFSGEDAGNSKAVPGPSALLPGNAVTSIGRGFPIPSYDSLTASAVLETLANLSAEELEAVRSHELANRGRRTVLHRIAQLTSERADATGRTAIDV